MNQRSSVTKFIKTFNGDANDASGKYTQHSAKSMVKIVTHSNITITTFGKDMPLLALNGPKRHGRY